MSGLVFAVVGGILLAVLAIVWRRAEEQLASTLRRDARQRVQIRHLQQRVLDLVAELDAVTEATRPAPQQVAAAALTPDSPPPLTVTEIAAMVREIEAATPANFNLPGDAR